MVPMTEKTGAPGQAEPRPVASSAIVSKRKLPHFPELDGLRGIAALMVFVHHYLQGSDRAADASPVLRGVIHLAGFGSNGVDIFFVLSGYLITSLLLVDRTQANYFHNFYWKRALRILPVYFVHLILTQTIIGDAWGYIWLSLIFIVNFSQRFHAPLKGVAWTLSIEEQFYLIWPQFVRRLRLQSLYYLAFALVIFSTLLRIAVPLATGRINIIYTPYRCDGLALGAILALEWFQPDSCPRRLRPLLKLLNSNLMLGAAAIAAAILIGFPDEGTLSAGARIGVTGYLAYRLIRRIIRSEAAGDTQRPEIAWLGSAVPAYFGRISYSLYLYHPFVLILMARHFGPVGAWSPGQIAARFPLALAITVAACSLSLFAMEIPIQRLRRFVLR